MKMSNSSQKYEDLKSCNLIFYSFALRLIDKITSTYVTLNSINFVKLFLIV